jgi:predicted permease
MTVAEIALAVTLVAGAGWLIRGFSNLRTTDPGFAADGRLMFDISLQGQKYRDQAAVTTASQDLLDRLRALPGVSAAASTFNFPLRGGPENSLFAQIQGEAMDPANPMGTRQRIVSPGFFDAMAVKLVKGRDFNSGDRQGTQSVAIVNETFVRRYLSGREPLGIRFSSGYPTINPQSETTIVGVVSDVRQRSLNDAAEPAFYSSMNQGTTRRQTVVVRSSQADTGPLQTAIRDEVRRMDPQIAVEFQLVSELVGSTLRRQELGMTLMLLFGAAAVALAAVGIYGVIAYAGAQRRGEVATRLALGATPANVFWLMLKQGKTLTAMGVAIGLATAYLAGRWVSSRLYEVRAADPLVLGAAAVIVVVIAVLATTIPAYRTARLDPARVLRPD